MRQPLWKLVQVLYLKTWMEIRLWTQPSQWKLLRGCDCRFNWLNLRQIFIPHCTLHRCCVTISLRRWYTFILSYITMQFFRRLLWYFRTLTASWRCCFLSAHILPRAPSLNLFVEHPFPVLRPIRDRWLEKCLAREGKSCWRDHCFRSIVPANAAKGLWNGLFKGRLVLLE